MIPYSNPCPIKHSFVVVSVHTCLHVRTWLWCTYGFHNCTYSYMHAALLSIVLHVHVHIGVRGGTNVIILLYVLDITTLTWIKHCTSS